MANNYRHSGNRVAVVSASGAIASGAIVEQEGFHGVALTSAASGASLWMAISGVWVLPVPAGVVKGNTVGAAAITESTVVTLLTPGTHLIGIATTDRAADGTASVLLLPPA